MHGWVLQAFSLLCFIHVYHLCHSTTVVIRVFDVYKWSKMEEYCFLSTSGLTLNVWQCETEQVFGFFSGASTPEETREGKKDKEGDRTSEEGKQKGKGSKPLMPTSTILRLLAELVRSYVGIATLIANYSYTVGQSELIKEVIFLVFPFSVIL